MTRFIRILDSALQQVTQQEELNWQLRIEELFSFVNKSVFNQYLSDLSINTQTKNLFSQCAMYQHSPLSN